MDENLDILIRTQANTAGAQAVKQELDKVKDAGVSANQEIGKKVEWLAGRKAELKAAVKGLAVEFPLLARLAQLALNPITMAVSAISLAFGIWKSRVEGLTGALQQVELPDISPDHAAHVNAAAVAWGKYAEELNKALSANEGKAVDNRLKEIDNHLALQLKLIEAQKQVRLASAKALGGPDQAGHTLGAEEDAARKKLEAERRAEQTKLDESLNQAAELSKRADKRRWEAAGIRIAGAEDDSATETELKKRSDAAQKSIEQRGVRTGFLTDLLGREGGRFGPRQLWRGLQYGWKYGWLTDPREALEMERSTGTSEEVSIQRYREWTGRRRGRAAQRAQRDALLSGAAADEAAAWGGMEDYTFGQAQLDQRIGGARLVNAMEFLTRAIEARTQGNQAAGGLAGEIQRGIMGGGDVSRLGNALAQQTLFNTMLGDYTRDLERQIRDLQSRGANRRNP